jgi:hypothetical protein
MTGYYVMDGSHTPPECDLLVVDKTSMADVPLIRLW